MLLRFTVPVGRFKPPPTMKPAELERTNRLVSPQVGFARPVSVWELFETHHDFLVVQYGPLPEPARVAQHHERGPLRRFLTGDLP